MILVAARTRTRPEIEGALLSILPNQRRRDLVADLLGHWRAMREVWRPAGDPEPAAVAAYAGHADAVLALACDRNGGLGGYISIPLYVHMVLEHVPDWAPDSIGAWSTEGLEANNRTWRDVLARLTVNNQDGIKQSLDVMWLHTQPELVEMAEREKRYQQCSFCGTPGHNCRNCPMRDADDDADDDDAS